jgi:CheY-like chemotaxis protein
MCLYLPRHLGSAEREAGPRASPPAQRSDGEGVLLVEDEEAIRVLVAEELESLGYRVTAVGDGPAALTVLHSQERVDLLITDVGLPGELNGRQVADAARARRPGLRVLFVTGYAQNAAVGNGLLEHGMEVVTKPFDLVVLANRVREMLER